jgi:hypothetical protein
MAYQLSSTSSAEKPGPIAIINPKDPGGGGSVMVSWRISSTETDDRFPFSGEIERVCGQVEHIFDGVDHLWAGRVQDPPRHVRGGQPVVGEEVVDVFTQVFLDDGGDLDGQDDPEPVGADVPAQHLLGVRVSTAAGGE